MGRVRSAIVDVLVGHPALIDVLDRAGARDVALRVDRRVSDERMAVLPLPAAPGTWQRPRVRALRRAGTDQCVEAFATGGWQGYERPLPDLLLGWLRTAPGTVFDVGANTGVYALIAASVPGARVHAFEAYPPVAALLRENLALNDSGGSVTVVDAAVSDTVAALDLHVPDPTGDLVETSCSLEESFKGGGGTVVTVDATTLDAYWHDLGEPYVSTVKVDVEGAEHRVLAGARDLLRRSRPVVFYEVLPGAELAQLEAVREEVGYVDVRTSATAAVVGEPIAFAPDAWNHALVPAEALEAFLAVVRACGLPVGRA